MTSLLFIICLLVGSFTFSTLLYIYFAYTSQPDPEEEFVFKSFKKEEINTNDVVMETNFEERVA